MTKIDIIAKISEKTNSSKKDVENFLNSFINVIEDAVVDGEKITLTGFLTIEAKETKARTARNPKTGEAIEVPASKKVSVKVGKAFKDAVKA